jgi:hypothetical protein
MGINLTSNFTEQASLPLDDREIVADITARNAIAATRRYFGLEVFVQADNTKYRLEADLTTWTALDDGTPSDAQYVVLATDSGLSQERVLTGTANQITITDGGAGNNVTLSTPQNLDVGTSFTVSNLTDTALTSSRLVQTGTSQQLSSLSFNSDGQLIIGATLGGFTLANLTAGTGISIITGPGSITIASTTSGGMAPADAQYVVLSLNGDLTNERVLAGTANQITVTDGGAGGNVQPSTAAVNGTTNTGGGGSLETAAGVVKGTNYTVTVGAGGSAGAAASGEANSGNDSVFSTITSIGGGGGGNTLTGGSGGGGSGNTNGTPGSAGLGTANQGYDGGAGSAGDEGGGGGGAGAVGTAGVNGTTQGNGGNGVATSITGSSVTYGGGGAGGGNNPPSGSTGTGGTGGGATTPTSQANGNAGTANTGGGGSGGYAVSQNYTGGAGGSGIVILRYLTADGTITIGAGLTGSTATDGSHKVTTITAGTGNVSWA